MLGFFIRDDKRIMAPKAKKKRKHSEEVSSAMPLYHQSYLVLRQRLNEGVYPAGQPLPSEEEIRQEFGVSRVTIRRALAQLEDEGLISRRRGSGTYPVADAPRPSSRANISGLYENLITLGLNTQAELRVFAKIDTPAFLSKLDGRFGDKVLHIVRVRQLENEPFSYMSSYVPGTLSAHFRKSQLGNQPLLMTLEMADIVAATAEQALSATAADAELADALGVPMGAPLIHMKRLSRDADQQPIEYFESFYRPDRFEYRMTLSRVRKGEAPHWTPIS